MTVDLLKRHSRDKVALNICRALKTADMRYVRRTQRTIDQATHQIDGWACMRHGVVPHNKSSGIDFMDESLLLPPPRSISFNGGLRADPYRP